MAENSFPKSRRLIRTAEFARVRREGRVWRGDLMSLAIAPALDKADPVRIGIIASRKTGGAVVRNRTRRRVREIFRTHQAALTDGSWVVTILSARAARVTYQQLEDEWLRLARRASILAP